MFQSLVATVSIAAFLAIGLAFALSFRLRTREFQINFLLGCSRWTTARLVGAEICLVAVMSGLIASMILGVALLSDDLFLLHLV